MASVPGKYLNFENIVRKVFDHTNDTLKTTAIATGPQAIVISSADDSIAIGNVVGDLMTVNPNGTIDTNIFGVTPVSGRLPVELSTSSTTKNYYNEVLAVASGSYVNILSKSVTVASKLKIVQTSGANIAEYEIELNGTVIDKQRTNFGTPLNCSFNFETGVALVSGDLLIVRTKHDRPSVADFNAKFIIEE